MAPSTTLKKSLIAGIALIAPLLVTVLAVQLVFGWLSGFLVPIVERTGLRALLGVDVVAELAALVILVAGLTLLGYVAQRSAGAYVFGVVDRVVGLVPILNVVYNGVRQVSDALTRQESRFESVVLVEYPREGIYSFGFVTAETSPEAAPEGGSLNVYIPGSPNPTQGQLRFIPEEQVQPVDIKVSRAIRLLVTTGIAERREEMEQLHEEVREDLGDGVTVRDAF
jgi:uncharacterized membrane protein